jgi:hypothetical protein
VAVPSGIIFIWLGTNASIPAGWSRATAYDAKFPRGADNGANAGGTGGSDTHAHTIGSHNHTNPSHTHPAGSLTNGGQRNTKGSGSGADPAHTHTTPESGSTTGTSQAASISCTGQAGLPAYYSVIFIQSNGTADIPNLAAGLWGTNASLPANWLLCDGNNSQPSISGNFLRGAAAGADAGATGGGTHSHSMAHTHTMDAHTHTSAASSAGAGGSGKGTATDASAAPLNHTHTLALAGQSSSVSDGIHLGAVQNVAAEPPFRVVQVIRNNTGAGSTPVGIIGLWASTIASIPTGWNLCNGSNDTPDMRSNFPKAGTSANVGTTGGAAGHGHSTASHHHEHIHTHTYTVGAATGSASVWSLTGTTCAAYQHTHSASSSSQTVQLGDAAITISDCADSRPAFVDVLFIQSAASSVVPNVVMNLIEM